MKSWLSESIASAESRRGPCWWSRNGFHGLRFTYITPFYLKEEKTDLQRREVTLLSLNPHQLKGGESVVGSRVAGRKVINRRSNLGEHLAMPRTAGLVWSWLQGCGKVVPETSGPGPRGSQGPPDPGGLLGPGASLKSTGMLRGRAPEEAEFPVKLERAVRTFCTHLLPSLLNFFKLKSSEHEKVIFRDPHRRSSVHWVFSMCEH